MTSRKTHGHDSNGALCDATVLLRYDGSYHLESPTVTRQLICIDGIDGSGKSFLADRLLQACRERGVEASLVGVDDFRRPLRWDPEACETDQYYDGYYDHAAMERCLQTFLAGSGRCRVPCFDSIREQPSGTRELRFGDGHVLLFEGVFCLRAPSVLQGTLIYLQTSFETARQRIVQRDQAKGRSLAEVQRRIDQRYFPAQRRYLAEYDPPSKADLLVEHETMGQLRLVRGTLPAVVGEEVLQWQ